MDLQALLAAELQDVAGAPVRLVDCAGSTPLVLVFLRHFGWLFCRERAAQLRHRESELQALGARIVFVGTGAPQMAAAFAREHAGAWPVLSDVQRRTYGAAGMKRGLGALLRLRLLGNVLRALRRGFRQGRVQGDPWQQGGVLVLDRRGRLLHQQLDVAAGDALDLDAVVLAVRGAKAPAP